MRQNFCSCDYSVAVLRFQKDQPQPSTLSTLGLSENRIDPLWIDSLWIDGIGTHSMSILFFSLRAGGYPRITPSGGNHYDIQIGPPVVLLFVGLYHPFFNSIIIIFFDQ